MFHTRITRTSIDAYLSLHASIRPRASRLAPRVSVAWRAAPSVPTDPLVTSRRASPRARDATARDATETRPRRVRSSARRRTRANARRDGDARRDRARAFSSLSRGDEKKRRHVGEIGRRQGEIGKSNDAVRDDVRVAVLVVRGDGDGGDDAWRRRDEGKARSGRERETRERMNE